METKLIILGLVFALFSSEVIGLFLKDSPSSYQQTKCAKSCPPGGGIVCGTDGKTYENVCYLHKEACEKKSDLAVDHPGTCDCPSKCMRNYKPVCAVSADTGKERTYPNLCQFKKTACEMKKAKKRLVFKRKGPCKKMSKCPIGCQDIFAPVCASNNKTYSSVCALKMASCNQNKRIGLLKIGLCQPGECPESCPFTYFPICGSDGTLYPSECELKLTACRKSTRIKRIKGKKSKKVCGKKCVSYCPEDESPVCGTDGISYGNQCKMDKINCEKGKKVKVAKRSACDLMPNNITKKKK